MRANLPSVRARSFSAPLPEELPDILHLLDERSAAFDASYGFTLPELLPRRLSAFDRRSRAC